MVGGSCLKGRKLIPIVYIQWVDAHTNTAWFENEGLDKWIALEDWYCNDVGYLVKEDERVLVFAQHHVPEGHANGDEQWGGLHRIPKTWLRNRKVLGYLRREDGAFVAVKEKTNRRKK